VVFYTQSLRVCKRVICEALSPLSGHILDAHTYLLPLSAIEVVVVDVLVSIGVLFEWEEWF
jgi:hypothetical protein